MIPYLKYWLILSMQSFAQINVYPFLSLPCSYQFRLTIKVNTLWQLQFN